MSSAIVAVVGRWEIALIVMDAIIVLGVVFAAVVLLRKLRKNGGRPPMSGS